MSQNLFKDSLIFSLSSNKKLVKKISTSLNIHEGKKKIHYFKDGELLAKTLDDVKDKNVIVIQSTSFPVCERYFELFLFLDSLKRGGAKNISLIIPYFGFSRQERVSFKNEPISCEVIADLLQSLHIDSIISVDIHHPIIESYFSIPFINVSTSKLFAPHIAGIIEKQHLNNEDIVIVGPDHGANERASELLSFFPTAKLIILEKTRVKPDYAEILVCKENIEDKTVFLIDDIIDTGITLRKTCQLLKELRVKQIHICATHGVFSKGSLRLLNKRIISSICVTDSIEKKYPKRVKVLSLDKLLEEVIIKRK